MKKTFFISIFLITLISGVFAQNVDLTIDTREFSLDKQSAPMGPKTKTTIEEFLIDAPTAVRDELGAPRYARQGIRYVDRTNRGNALIALKNSYDITAEGKRKIVTQRVEIGAGTNAIISGSVFYGENKKTKIAMKLYLPKGTNEETGEPIFYPHETNVVRTRKSVNFIEEDEKVDRMIRRMTRRLLGQRLLKPSQSYAVTGAGLTLVGTGAVLYVNSNRRYHNIYKEHRYILDTVYDDFKDENDEDNNPRQAYFDEKIKKPETLSFVLGGLGIAMTTLGTYEIILNRKDKRRIFNEINDIIGAETSQSKRTLSISSDIVYNPFTLRTDPQLKLTYRF